MEDPGGIEFNLPISDWFALFLRTGFDVLDFRELRALRTRRPTSGSSERERAHRFPTEQIWHLRKRERGPADREPTDRRSTGAGVAQPTRWVAGSDRSISSWSSQVVTMSRCSTGPSG